MSASEELYKAQAEAQPNTESTGSQQQDGDNVQDADFEEVK